uniref:Uncharacterized protein n=1 Tax=Rhizophora mucronata TaxID=61149 RepID=A0A2P2P0A2_RHIMU
MQRCLVYSSQTYFARVFGTSEEI